jgi:hypothetical protein
MGEVHRILVGKPDGRDHFGDLDIDGRSIFVWISNK